MWGLGSYKESIDFLEGKAKGNSMLNGKLETLKKQYEKECGLPFEHPTSVKMETFIKWMKENGAIFDNIRMRYYGPDYRGVHCTKDIEQNGLFLYVPKKIIITSQAGKETPIGEKIVNSQVQLNWDYLVYITVHLLTQFHDPNSVWKPYMDVYPKNVDNFPMFYTEEEKKMLTGSSMVEHITSEIEEIKEEYDEIVKAVPEFSQFSFDEYIKNKTLVISRIFYVDIHGKTERIMVPLAGINRYILIVDMFNHYYERIGESYWKYDNKDNAFIVMAQKKIHKGDPVK